MVPTCSKRILQFVTLEGIHFFFFFQNLFLKCEVRNSPSRSSEPALLSYSQTNWREETARNGTASLCAGRVFNALWYFYLFCFGLKT